MTTQPILDWEADIPYTDDESLTDTSSTGDQKKICRRGKRGKQREKTPVIERIQRRLRAIKQIISDELRMWGVVARKKGNFDLSKALNSKLKEWSDLYVTMENEASRTLPCCDKGNNDAARWKSAGKVMEKIVEDIFNFFREICNILPRERRAHAASSLVFRLVSSTYESGKQGTKPVYNQTLVEYVPNFTLYHVLEKFPELSPLHETIIDSWGDNHYGASASPKKRLIHFRRVMESLYTLTSVAAVPSPITPHKKIISPFEFAKTPNTITSLDSLPRRNPRRNPIAFCPNAFPSGMSAMSAVPSRRSYSQTTHFYFRSEDQPQPPQLQRPSQPTAQFGGRVWPQLPQPPVLNTLNPSFSAPKQSESAIGFANGQTIRPNTVTNQWMYAPLNGPSPFFE